MIAPKSYYQQFAEYFSQFSLAKVEDSFRISNAVCVVFDAQNRGQSAKDFTREKRDAKGKECPDMIVEGNASLPPQEYEWTRNSLRNRNNKKFLVHYICKMLLQSDDSIKPGKYVSYKRKVWGVGADCKPLLLAHLYNNHEKVSTCMIPCPQVSNVIVKGLR